jgi:hypothetical protein
MMRHENIHELVRIDNIWSAGDHGLNHICKLVIESETLVLFARWTQKEFCQMNTTCNYLENGIWIADDIRVEESSISMAVIISRMYVASSRLGEISIIWRPLCSHCISLWILSTLNMFLQTGYLFLLIPNLPPSSPPCLGCGSIILWLLSISWHWIQLIWFIPLVLILALLLQHAFVIFATAESTVVVCGQSTAPFLILILVDHCIGS